MQPFVTENFLLITDNDQRGNSLQHLTIYNMETGEKFSIPTHTFRGIWAEKDGGYLNIFIGTGWKGGVEEIQFNPATGEYQQLHSIRLEGFISEIVFDKKCNSIFAFNLSDGSIWKVDISSWDAEKIAQTGAAVYDATLTDDGRYLLLTDWTGDSIIRYEIATGKSEKLKVGKFPEEIVTIPGETTAYVSISGEDSIVKFDYQSMKILKKISLQDFDKKGLYPSGMTICPERKWLLVTLSKGNYMDVIDYTSDTIIGKIPTLWYPTGIICHEAKGKIIFSNAKGIGGESWSGSAKMSQWNLTRGIVTIMEIPDQDKLTELTSEVEENYKLMAEVITSPCSNQDTFFRRFPIEHVILIVRENKTYDEVLGDLEGADGDPTLTLFGENITPNLHELAREFTNCDRFFSNPEVSFQGHVWTTYADITDYLDKTWQNLIPFAGVETAATSSEPSFFYHLWKLGIDFRIYGEVAGVGTDIFGFLWDHVDMKYPFYNLDIPDVEKAQEFIRELQNGILKPYTYISLPRDHTYGYYPGKETPESMVADNDEATGMIIDAVSHSPFWKNTIIFIIEDDPQSFAGDHIEAHRSICVIVGPYIKRHYTSSVPYSIPSIFKTIELLWGLPHLNRNTILATPMFDIFTDKPDLTPYNYIPRKIPVDFVPQNHPLAEESKEVFKDLDESPGLGFILWRGIKGDIAPPPYAMGVDR